MDYSENILNLLELPVSHRTITVDKDFMLSDNIGMSIPSTALEDLVRLSDRGPFKIRFTSIVFCTRGRLSLRINLHEHVVTSGDMLFVPEGAIGEFSLLTADSELILFAFSKDFNVFDSYLKSKQRPASYLVDPPILTLTPREMDDVVSIYKILRHRLDDPQFLSKREMAIASMRTISYYLSAYITLRENEPPVNTRATTIFDRFVDLVEEYSLNHRELAFYADRLAITPKYLSKVVLERSGKSAKSWIQDRVILEAKVLLREENLSIQQISDRLSFPNQSFFGVFFKKEVGISPIKYRNRQQ